MDIMITLPKDLIDKILSGEKTIEVRKNYPRVFNRNYNWVYVVQKGTRNVVLKFEVVKFYFCGKERLWQVFETGKICIDFDWLKKYAERSDRFVCWYIGRIKSLIGLDATLDDYNVKTAPQSFVYLEDWNFDN